MASDWSRANIPLFQPAPEDLTVVSVKVIALPVELDCVDLTDRLVH